MKTVVSNTGPLIALASVQKIDILRELFQTVFVPAQVHEEILAGGARLGGLPAYTRADWLIVADLRQPLDPLLYSVLDQGEASVIHLARELEVPQVLIDERKGRKVARDIYGLEVMGTARLLVEAKRANLLANVCDVLEDMRGKGYWIHEDIVNAAARAAGERP